MPHLVMGGHILTNHVKNQVCHSNAKEIIKLRIDYCDEHLIQESSYISGVIRLIHIYHMSYEAQYISLLDHTSKNEIRHKFSGK